MILSRADGAIVQTSGFPVVDESVYGDDDERETSDGPHATKPAVKGIRRAEAVARAVMSFLDAAGSLVQDLMDDDDGVKLLRLRTRQNELVIVPGITELMRTL